MVKFLNGENDLSRIEIVLTDFGLAGPDSKGGTPMFASPECLANKLRKNKSSDIFSLGRVFLFVILPKVKFLEFLFVSLTQGGKEKIMEVLEKDQVLNIISKMTQVQNRIDLRTIRKALNSVIRNYSARSITKISDIIQKSASQNTYEYIDVLKHFS